MGVKMKQKIHTIEYKNNYEYKFLIRGRIIKLVTHNPLLYPILCSCFHL